MEPRASLVATLTSSNELERLELLARTADILEYRADRVEDVALEYLRSRFPGPILFTLRSNLEGGNAAPDATERWRRLLAAAEEGYDLVDLEADRDLGGELLSRLPAERRIVSWHGEALEPDALRRRAEKMLATPAAWYKLVPTAEDARQAFPPLEILYRLGRRDVIAFAAGTDAAWTRLLAPRLGAPVVFAAAGEAPAAPGQPSLQSLRQDYGLPSLPPIEALYGVVGAAPLRSLSPRLHNAAYRALDLPYLYLAFSTPKFGDFWMETVDSGRLRRLEAPLRGLSVTSPHKQAAAAVAGALSPVADHLDAANTLTLRDGVWEAESTDGQGIVGALTAHGVAARDVDAAVLGAGGAGRAAAWALQRQGARVVLVNRSQERGRRVAARLGVPFQPLDAFDAARHTIVVQATPLGSREDDALIMDPSRLADGAVLVDFVYLPSGPSPLVLATRAAGRHAVDGREVLLHQAVQQFRILTGKELPLPEAHASLGLDRRLVERPYR